MTPAQNQIRDAVTAAYVRTGVGLTAKEIAAVCGLPQSRVYLIVREGVEGLQGDAESRDNKGPYSNYVGGVHRVTVYGPTRRYLASLLAQLSGQ